MLNVTDLNNYLEECKNEIEFFNKIQLLVDDDEFGKFSRDISKDVDKVVLIGVIPSISGAGADEDNVKANNRLMFYAVQKEDSRQLHANYITGFQICQDAVRALFAKFLADHLNFDKRCMANNFDFNKFNIDPVRNYHQTNGWVLEINLTTEM